ncbi:MAG TPA: hypothetical protein VIS96_10670 [Terrimicrobiaceae bacterium]
MKSSCSEQRFEEANRELRGGRMGDGMPFLFGLLSAVSGFLVLGGCAAFEIRTKTTALSESGFVARLPETPKQQEAYATLPAYKVHRGVVKGNVFYAYKDEKNGVVYLGSEAEYQRYLEKVRRLVAAFETTEERMVASDMDVDLQWRWYGSWLDVGAPHLRD